jgi:hypothetical protein
MADELPNYETNESVVAGASDIFGGVPIMYTPHFRYASGAVVEPLHKIKERIANLNLKFVVLPAGNGKTTLAKKYGWIDVDDIIKPNDSLTKSMKEKEQWDVLNCINQQMVESFRPNTVVLIHSLHMIPDKWKDRVVFSGRVNPATISVIAAQRAAKNPMWGKMTLLNNDTSPAPIYEDHDVLHAAVLAAVNASGWTDPKVIAEVQTRLKQLEVEKRETPNFVPWNENGYPVDLSVPSIKGVVSRIKKWLPKLASNEVLPHYSDQEFAWLRGVDYDWGDDVEEVLPICPIQRLDPKIERMVRQIGTSIGGDNNALKTNSLFAAITGDRKFPKTVSDEEIFHELTRPGVLGNQPLMEKALVALGADPGRVAAVVQKFSGIVDMFIFVKKTSSYSTRDGILGLLDLSQRRYSELVSMPPIADNSLLKAYQSVMFLAMVIEGTRPDGTVRHAKLRLDGARWAAMVESVKVTKSITGEKPPGVFIDLIQ